MDPILAAVILQEHARMTRRAEAAKKRYHADPEKYRASAKKWAAAHPETIAAAYKRDTAKPETRTMINARKGNRRQKEQALKAGPCMDCGGTFPTECMDWDHVRGEKTTNVAKLNDCSLAKVMDEIAKCDLVCANCHRIRTRRRARQEV